ncbi:MAG: hypothetical protein ACXQT5_03715 [Candidatus Syntropharchaeia archaeon]
MGLKQLKYVDLDDEKGRLYAAGSPHLLVPITLVRSIRGVLRKIAGDVHWSEGYLQEHTMKWWGKEYTTF